MARKRTKLNKKEIQEVMAILEEVYPDAKAELDFENPFQLLIATILSAQCTDVRVNMVTKELFKELITPSHIHNFTVESLGKAIKSCGLYKSKAQNIYNACILLEEKYGGEVPDTIEELVKLPGVGRKTANVVASNAYGVPAIAVDTHVFRVSNRIGLAHSDNVNGTEKDLMKRLPKEKWTKFHHVLIFHGRRCCSSRKPKCQHCQIADYCLHYKYNILDK